MRSLLTILCLWAFLYGSLFAQTHTSVPLESHIYYILEQAELKGLCAPLSGVRPYTQKVVLKAINEILESEDTKRLNSGEREILKTYFEHFSKPRNGMDWQRGMYYGETSLGKNDTLLSLNVGTNLDMEASAGFYPNLDKNYFGTEIWLRFYFNGDIGSNVSWLFAGEGGLMKAPRRELGYYNTYYEDFIDSSDGQYVNQYIIVYSEPLTHFPYSYKRRWDASVHPLGSLSSMSDFESWPDPVCGAYNLLSELTGSFFDDKLLLRLGRLSHEWGSIPFGSSLALNQMARPFLGFEYEFNPLSWFGISTMTGFLEFFNTKGEKASGMTFQNAYSISLMQFRYKNYFFLDLGESVVWPKRLEFGYISPITNTIFYKNNIGDFDNLAAIVNIKGQYPGVGNIWASLFWDEIWWKPDWYELDRSMFAWQAGMNFALPFLSFSSLKLSYSKVNPYCYTHNRVYTPWYGERSMEESYTNNGASLGYYLPPNSDEILVRYKTMPVRDIYTYLQYQLIRHGADFGSKAVDGSNLQSELGTGDNEIGRNDNPVLKRFFLQDGAYQWMHIVRIGAEWNLSKLPVALYGEAGVNYSYFTDIKEPANVTGKAHPYSRINTTEYPESTGFIVQIGVRIFPRL